MTEVRKTYPVAQLKAGSPESGTVEAIVSVFGNVDLVGDRVIPGAFLKTIDMWKGKNAKGRYLPFTDGHDWSREGRVGKVIDMAETPEGLWVKAKMFMDQQSARDIYTQIKEGVLGEFSFAYDVKQERKAKDGANELTELDILDAAAAVYGANSETRLVSIKAHFKADVDTSEWDGSAAMASCETAADYRAICAGEKNVGDPDERQHWALPHHSSPGGPPNEGGVRNALSRLPQTEGLTNAEEARSHLERHMTAINPDYGKTAYVSVHSANTLTGNTYSVPVPMEQTVTLPYLQNVDAFKVGRVLSAKSEQRIRDAITALESVLSQVAQPQAEDGKTETEEVLTKSEEPEAKSEDEEPTGADDDEEVRLRAELARLRAS